METRYGDLYARVIPKRSKLRRFEYVRHDYLQELGKTQFDPKREGCRACKAECPIQRQTMRRILGLIKKLFIEAATELPLRRPAAGHGLAGGIT